MQVKNKILEQLDESIRPDFYEMLNEDTQLAIGNADTPQYYNVTKCGEQFIICKPKDFQLPYCEGRVMSLYDYFPFLQEEAKELKLKPKDEAMRLLELVSSQYEPNEVYDYMMQGLEDNSIFNIFENKVLEEYYDKESNRCISIAEILHKGEWKGYSCLIFGNEPNDFKDLNYPLERDIKKAMRYFGKRLDGENYKLFSNLQLQREMEAE